MLPFMQLKPSQTSLAGRGRFRPCVLHVDLPMTVGMQQLQVVRRVRSASAAPDAMVDLAVLLCEPQRLTTDPTSSLLSLPESVDPTVTCPRLGQLPTPPCFQVQFPLRIVGIDGAPDLHVANDPHRGCIHQLDRPILAFRALQLTGEDRVAVTVSLEVGLLDPLPTLLPVPSPAPPPHHSGDPVIDVVEGAFARRIAVIHGPTLDLLIQTLDHDACR